MPRPPSHPVTRILAALVLGLAVVIPLAPPVAAREPHLPVPNYRPAFVTEREAGEWNDCLWASASMLLDKWSAGRLTASKDRLRHLSGDRHGGSNFRDLAPVLRSFGLDARWSPEGGDFVTWGELRTRISKGGGAVLLGDYSKLPRWYARWDLAFWRKKGDKDNHAIYLDRYDGKRDRFWVMDPLAPPGWRGEWIPARYLKAYAWKTGGGGIWVMMTPPAKRPPFSGVRLAPATAAQDGGDVRLSWTITKAPKRWKLPPTRLITTVTPLADPAALGALDPVVIPAGTTERAAKSRVGMGSGRIVARVPTPSTPGAYKISLAIRDRRFGRLATRGGAIVYVTGDRRGTVLAADPGPQQAGSRMELELVVSNTGAADWSDDLTERTPFAELMEPRHSVVRASWRPVAVDGAAAAATPPSLDLLAVPLRPGEHTSARVALQAPSLPGRWALTLDLTDRLDGSFAAGGSAPRVLIVEVVGAPGSARTRL